jgi:hypothetical protein
MKNLLLPFLCVILLGIGACDDSTINPKDVTQVNKSSITEDIIFQQFELDSNGWLKRDSNGNYCYDLYAINMDGSGLRKIRSFPYEANSWLKVSPNATKVIIKTSSGLHLSHIDSNNFQFISPETSDAVWFPDSKSILYGGGTGGVFEFDGQSSRLINIPGEKRGFTINPADSRTIIYYDSNTIYSIDKYGQNNKLLFKASEPNVKVSSLFFSPDGKQIAFQKYSSQTSNSPDLGLFIMNADGSGVRQLRKERCSVTDWSNDGKRILVRGTMYSSGAGSDIYAVVIKEINNDGTLGRFQKGNVSSGGGISAEDVAWINNEKDILFSYDGVAQVGWGSVGGTLYIANADGTNERLLVNYPYGEGATVQWVKK